MIALIIALWLAASLLMGACVSVWLTYCGHRD
jgi:hypothetical protein